MRRTTLLWMLCIAGCGGGYGTGTPTPSDYDVMRETLRDYLSAQEVYYSQHETYTSNVADIVVASERARIEILTADERGHAAVISHEDNADAGCAVFVGNVAPPSTPGGRVAEREGVVTCDEP